MAERFRPLDRTVRSHHAQIQVDHVGDRNAKVLIDALVVNRNGRIGLEVDVVELLALARLRRPTRCVKDILRLWGLCLDDCIANVVLTIVGGKNIERVDAFRRPVARNMEYGDFTRRLCCIPLATNAAAQINKAILTNMPTPSSIRPFIAHTDSAPRR